MDIVEILGVKVNNISVDEGIEKVKGYLKGDELKSIYTPNPEIIMGAKEKPDFKDLINRGDLVTADGIGLIYACKIKKRPLKGRVTGLDLSYELLKLANENSYSLYLLGGKEGVSQKAAENIKKDYPNIRIGGFHHGYFKGSHLGLKDQEEENEIIKEINMAKPDIIFVGLGFPKQELWIDTNKARINGKVIIGNGGVMDVLSGNVKKAPDFIRKIGFEWLYRLIKEPSRIKRQLILPKFMINIIFNRNVVK